MFGPQAVQDFVDDNSLVCIIRAHEVMKEGFREYRFRSSDRPVPMVYTIFSAPIYLGTYENKGVESLFCLSASHNLFQLPC